MPIWTLSEPTPLLWYEDEEEDDDDDDDDCGGEDHDDDDGDANLNTTWPTATYRWSSLIRAFSSRLHISLRR